jgi:hypothetical protein
MRKRGYFHRECFHHPMPCVSAMEDGADVNDVEVAISILRRNVQSSVPPTSQLHQAPLILKSHISTIINDVTEIERGLDALRRQNVIRLLKVSNSHEIVIVFTQDYNNLLDLMSLPKQQLAQFKQFLGECSVTSTNDFELKTRCKCDPSFAPLLLDLGLLRMRDSSAANHV